MTGGILVGWVLAIVLALAPSPLYSAYSSLAHRPGGLSALGDQQIAAGVMWVPGSIAFTIAFIVFLYRWLGPEPAGRRPHASASRAPPIPDLRGETMLLTIASHFFAGSLLTLLLPVGASRRGRPVLGLVDQAALGRRPHRKDRVTESRISLRRAGLVVGLASAIGIAAGGGLYLLDSHRSPSANAGSAARLPRPGRMGSGRAAARRLHAPRPVGRIRLPRLAARPPRAADLPRLPVQAGVPDRGAAARLDPAAAARRQAARARHRQRRSAPATPRRASGMR